MRGLHSRKSNSSSRQDRRLLGHLKLSALTHLSVEDFKIRLRNDEQPRSPKAVARVVRTLGTLGYAQDNGLGASRNVVKDQSRRKLGKKKKHKQPLIVRFPFPTKSSPL